MSGSVLLRLAGSPRWAFAPRVVAAWLAEAQGASLECIEDARLAVDELVAPLLQAGCGVELWFRETDDGIEVVLMQSPDCARLQWSPLAERILAATSKEFAPLTDRSGWRLQLRV